MEAYDEDYITIEELFQEELDCLRELYDRLIGAGSQSALQTAENLEHVIRYFESRLDQTTEVYFEPTLNNTIH